MSELTPAIVIDNGSYAIKAGFSGEDAPKEVFPTTIARNPARPLIGSSTEKEFIIGRFSSELDNKSPFENRRISNWDYMENIWHFTFYEALRVAPEEAPIILTEHLNTPKEEREKITQIMFETFNAPSFYLANDSVLSAFASGKLNAVVVNMGEEETQIVPMFEGNALPYASSTIELGGRHITDYLINLVKLNGHGVESFAEKEIVRDLKEKKCYVAKDYDQEMESFNFELPDKTKLDIGKERFQAPELYFHPQLYEIEQTNLSTAIHNSIMKLDIDLHRIHYYSRVLLSGASSLFPGIEDRLHHELFALSPVSANVRVDAPSERKISTFIGASILGSLSTFENLAISKDQYEEVGPCVVHRKCF
ncbi:hypothetical protein NAEGRDRAFT_74761 [Naegleria gruberi]|uniref:Actin n=1 Tax=Naegleria gruberi TaxID=5762 RepID=D2W078_NAEGR|nr:uncharacterized protein NAEGRDRAFT_74761 [Naegleria gruberi]EFC37569.1 hypothetical protein NAEGRDRAFT_74761 [Naegleria gruberi]|eukprot:XP_002670313.1 hypothetical protein NAEGRDRAFT_74761 [Naegleria gruberi strain NEG-M]